jgi:hypothetical protein
MMAAQPTGEPPQEPSGSSPQEAMGEPPSEWTLSGTVAYVTFTIKTETPPRPRREEDQAPPQDPRQALLDAIEHAATAAAEAASAARHAATAAEARPGTQQEKARLEAQAATARADAAERAARAAKEMAETARLPARPALDDADLLSKLDGHHQQLEEELLAQFQKPFGRYVTVKLMAVSASSSVEIITVISLAVYVVGNYVQIVGGLRQAIEETRVAFRGIVRSLTGVDLADDDVEARWRPGPALVELHAAEFPRRERTPEPRPRTRVRLLPVIDRVLLVLLVVLVVTVLVLLVIRTG